MSSEKDNFDVEVVRDLAEILNNNSLTRIKYKIPNALIVLEKENSKVIVNKGFSDNNNNVPIASSSMDTNILPVSSMVANEVSEDINALKSPMVGIIYLRPDPSSEPFCKVGDGVDEGQTLLLIEAMKVFNPILAPSSGVVKKILVDDGSPVEYGQPLIVIE